MRLQENNANCIMQIVNCKLRAIDAQVMNVVGAGPCRPGIAGVIRPSSDFPYDNIFLRLNKQSRPGGPCRTVVCLIYQVLVLVFAYLGMISVAVAVEGLEALEQKAILDAVERVAPSVVRIETIGGMEQVEGLQFGVGATTGLIVDKDGYIVSSAFNFINKPASILVLMPDGARKPAKLVATDHVRMLVLLKVDVDQPLPVCEYAPADQMRVGQWTIALGRTFAADKPNVSVGILSAKDRVWGKALQTDAAVSPANYGGPLVDIHGRVMGVIVPLSPESSDELAGYEWYDSGIGFAIPIDHIEKILPRLKKGEDLQPGYVGVSMMTKNIYISEPIISVCRFKSPAAEADFKPGDKIIAVNGRPISRSAEFREEISQRYAGDKFKLTVLRGDERLERELTLAEKIEPYQPPFLGLLPMRNNDQAGIKIRFVYPDGPAAKAHLAPGDIILSLNGKPINHRNEMLETLFEFQPAQSIDLEVLHDGKKEPRKLTLGAVDQSLPPARLPPAHEKIEAEKTAGLQTGTIKLKIPEYPHETFAYVPENYNSKVRYGLIVWLHGREGLDWEKIVASWKPLCDQYDLILAAPKSSNSRNWAPAEGGLVQRLMGQIFSLYNIDPSRIAVSGQESGGTLASMVAARNRETIRALVVVEAPPAFMPPENDPQYSFAVYAAWSNKSPSARLIEKSFARLRELKIPLTEKSLGDDPRNLSDEEWAELARWIDMLDRI